MMTSIYPLVRACLVAASVATLAAAQNDFATWVGYDTGTGSTARHPYDCAVGDFDHDGDPDLATVNWWSYPKLGVLLNNGDGSYAPPVLYPARASYGVVVADFDADSWDDIMVSDYGNNGELRTVSLYRNAGDGTFLPRQPFQAGPGPLGLATADFDGDGDIDVAVANNRFQSDTVALLLNNGRGEFAAPVFFIGAPTPATNKEPAVLAAADLNGDALPDLAVGNDNQYVTVLINTGGAFGAPVTYDTEMGPNAGFYPSIAVDDIDKDGDVDVLYSNTLTQTLVTVPRVWFAGAVAVFRNDGTGALATAEGYGLAAGIGFADMALADVDGDGWNDILGVWQANGGWGALYSDGEGGFRSPTIYASADEPMAVAAADVDGDADVDAIIVGRESLEASIHRNPGDGDFAPPPICQAGFLTNRNLDAADVDGDGDLDVATCWAGSTGGGVDILLNSGAGVLGPKVSYPSSQGACCVKLRDLNGDSAPDLVWADDTLDPPYNFKTRLNRGDGTFGPQRSWAVGTCGTWELDAFDVDGDGDLDVVMCDLLFCGFTNYLYVRRNNGDGTFAPVYQVVGDGAGITDFVGADFDNDGNLDILSVTTIGLNFLAGNGDGTFRTPIVTLVRGSSDRLIAADLNGDGNLDVAVTGRNQPAQLPGVHILLGFGDGGFNISTHYLAAYSGVRYVEGGDADGDGDVDIMVANISANDVSLFRNNGDGSFQPQVRYGAAGRPTDLRFGDFTGDGVGDLAVVMGDTIAPQGGGAGVEILPGLPPCDGFFSSYGTGLPGTGRRAPFHSGAGCPTPGGAISWRAANGPAGAPAALLIGTAAASVPVLGGTVLAGGQLVAVPAQLDVAGFWALPLRIPSVPGLSGTVLYTQVVVADPATPSGVAFSAGMATHIE